MFSMIDIYSIKKQGDHGMCDFDFDFDFNFFDFLIFDADARVVGLSKPYS